MATKRKASCNECGKSNTREGSNYCSDACEKKNRKEFVAAAVEAMAPITRKTTTIRVRLPKAVANQLATQLSEKTSFSDEVRRMTSPFHEWLLIGRLLPDPDDHVAAWMLLCLSREAQTRVIRVVREFNKRK